MPADRQEPSADQEDQEDSEWAAAVKRFDEQTKIADFQLMVQSWSAWAVNPGRKRIAPIARICLGDDDGNVILDRCLHLPALAEVVNQFCETVLLELNKVIDVPGFSADLPGGRTMLNELQEAHKRISAIIDLVEKNSDVIVDSMEELRSSSSSSSS
jgi:hypothetical protein